VEPLTAITSQQKFEELVRKRTSKEFLDTLKDFKEACDKIEAIRGKMSYAAVAKIASRHINTIKSDKEGHREYIKLRQAEYEGKNKTALAIKVNAQKVAVQMPRYPASELDAKTRSFIDLQWQEINNLKNRNAQLETTITEVRKEVLDQTREKPLDARKMLRNGPDDTGSMAIVVAGEDAPRFPLTPKLREALEKVLQLGGHHHSLCLEKGRLMLKTPSRDILLIYPAELRAIAEAIGKELPSGE
jgi:hypothetical protein